MYPVLAEQNSARFVAAWALASSSDARAETTLASAARSVASPLVSELHAPSSKAAARTVVAGHAARHRWCWPTDEPHDRPSTIGLLLAPDAAATVIVTTVADGQVRSGASPPPVRAAAAVLPVSWACMPHRLTLHG